MTQRTCRKCNISKSLDNFGLYQVKGRSYKSHRQSCNSCRREESKKRYLENPEVMARMKKTAKLHHISKTYGLNESQYLELLNNSARQMYDLFKYVG